MKIEYIKNDGEASYFILSIKKTRYGYKPVLKTPEGISHTLYKGSKSGFFEKQACTEDTITLIKDYKDNTIIL